MGVMNMQTLLSGARLPPPGMSVQSDANYNYAEVQTFVLEHTYFVTSVTALQPIVSNETPK